ncbi:MAG: hypothetical protein A2Y12_12780 [Planctomycetes bacterium GWF2_42_9]|nr:MAG: hypothetical protein A2Y12_12780 [Planctomycetes bacterium GWF2_42_9]
MPYKNNRQFLKKIIKLCVKIGKNKVDRQNVMITTEKTTRFRFLSRLFSSAKAKTVSVFFWYPSSRGAIGESSPNTKTVQLPPLMVRKAAWRR